VNQHNFCRTCSFVLFVTGLLVTLSSLALMGSARADASTANLPERTLVRVKILETIKSGDNKAGEEVPFALSEDVYDINHQLVLRQGTLAYGTITQSSRRGMFGKAGKLRFTCDYIVASDRIHVPLRSDPMIVRGKDNRGATTAVVILISPLGLLINGKDVTVERGTEFKMYVDKDTTLPVTTSN
jgi:hypothetical protein